MVIVVVVGHGVDDVRRWLRVLGGGLVARGGAWWAVGGWEVDSSARCRANSGASRFPLVRMRAFVGQALARADGFGLDAPELCPALTGLAWF